MSFGDEPIYDSNLNSYNQTPDISNPPSQPQTSSFNQFHCFYCKDLLEDGICCQRCTCVRCGYYLGEGFCSFCNSEDGNSFINDSNPNSFNDAPNGFTHPPQPQYESYLCELCENDSHYGYDCPLRFPLVYERELSYNQNFSDNYYLQNSPSFPQQYLCCENCEGPHEMVIQQKQAASIDQSPLQEISIQDMEDLKQHYLDEMLSLSNDLHIKDYRNEKIDIHFRRECENMIDELKGKFNGMSIEINKKKELQRLEQVANLGTYPSQRFKSFCYDDDDDYDYKKSTIPLNKIDSQIPPSIAITPVLEPEDSLIIWNEDLSTIPEKESDEFIKSSVKDLVPIPSESEDTSESDSYYDLLLCDDFSPINIYTEKSMTFSNPLFDSNGNFTSSDDESLSDEDVPEDNVKIYLNPLFEFDDEYISSDVNPLFDEVLENIESKDSYVSNLDEPALLVTPLSDVNKDECFDPGGRIDEIDVFLDIDISTDIENDYHDLEGDIIYLESLLIDDIIPNLSPEIPSGESKVHIEVLSVLWGNRPSILDGSLPLSRVDNDLQNLSSVEAEFPAIVINPVWGDDSGLASNNGTAGADDCRVVAGPQPRGSVGKAGDSGDVTGWLLGQPGTTPGLSSKSSRSASSSSVRVGIFDAKLPIVLHHQYMALPPREQRHRFLRYKGLEYPNTDIVDFEGRLARIHRREVHKVSVFDFGGLPDLQAEGLSGRMLMDHRDEAGAESARQIPDKGDLRDYWMGISSAGDFLATALSYTSIRDQILRLCHRLIACSIAGRSQAHEKVTVTNLFYLRGMDVGSVNVPYLLARYLRLFAVGRKSGAHISGGQFVARLAEHFRLLTAKILGGLTVISPELPIIDMTKLVRLQIYAQFDDT
ncbi:hypothetical protein Tco_1018608 [Tanacetum coccineum]|uniref:Uncharacterized protein n=1 Tax=Tanacetum coccineum TaxID=301880 RepID=A0ABQ5FW65_9ASTR